MWAEELAGEAGSAAQMGRVKPVEYNQETESNEKKTKMENAG